MSTVTDPRHLRRTPNRILAVIDGTHEALVAVEEAAKLAHRTAASLHLVSPYEPMPRAECARYSYQLGPLAYQLQGSNPAESDAREAAAHAALFGVPADYAVVRGRPVEVLRRVAKERAADLLVVPDTGRRSLVELLRPSLATCLQQQAPCDVLLVPCRGVDPTALFPSGNGPAARSEPSRRRPTPHPVATRGHSRRRGPAPHLGSLRGRPGRPGPTDGAGAPPSDTQTGAASERP
jgi:nucleotide-binding universal stress UspA family protein